MKEAYTCIETEIKESAKLVLDGRNATVKGYEDDFMIGHCLTNMRSNKIVFPETVLFRLSCVKKNS